MAWGLEQLQNRQSPSVTFDPELWTRLGSELRKRKYNKDVSKAMQDNPGGDDEANERQMRAMAQSYAAYDPDKAQEWMSAADQVRERIEARKQSGNIASGQQALKSRELDIESEKLKNKQAEPPNDLTSDDFKSGMAAFSANSYPAWWQAKTQNGKFYPELPKPELEPSVIETALQAGQSGDFVKARTISNQMKQSTAETQIKQSGVTPAKLEETTADKSLKYITTPIDSPSGKPREPLIPEVQKKVDEAKADYDKRITPLNTWMQQVDKLKSVLPQSGPAKDFGAIAAIVDFNKIIDPTSVVREAEFNIAQDATGAFEKMKATLSSYFDGQTLTEEGVKKLREFADKNEALINRYIDRLNSEAEGRVKRIGGGAEYGDIVTTGGNIVNKGD